MALIYKCSRFYLKMEAEGSSKTLEISARPHSMTTDKTERWQDVTSYVLVSVKPAAWWLELYHSLMSQFHEVKLFLLQM